MDIGVVGGGSWGTALARLLATNGHNLMVWAHGPEVVEQINETQENKEYLPDIDLPTSLRATSDMEEAVAGKDVILSVSPSHVLREVLEQLVDFLPEQVPIVSATKGIENQSLMLVSDILEDVLPSKHHPFLAYLSGPSFAREVAKEMPTAVTIASHNASLAVDMQRLFSNGYFRCYTSNDVIGVEIGGALKNVIAIASGAASGMELGLNASAGMITRGLHEITRLAVKKGANPLTLTGLAGMGDLVLTCTGGLSRNRTVGYKLGSGMSLDQILEEMNMVAEGVKTSKSVYDLSRQMGVEMPISEQVYAVIYEGKSPHQAVQDLMNRDLKPELGGWM